MDIVWLLTFFMVTGCGPKVDEPAKTQNIVLESLAVQCEGDDNLCSQSMGLLISSTPGQPLSICQAFAIDKITLLTAADCAQGSTFHFVSPIDKLQKVEPVLTNHSRVARFQTSLELNPLSVESVSMGFGRNFKKVLAAQINEKVFKLTIQSGCETIGGTTYWPHLIKPLYPEIGLRGCPSHPLDRGAPVFDNKGRVRGIFIRPVDGSEELARIFSVMPEIVPVKEAFDRSMGVSANLACLKQESRCKELRRQADFNRTNYEQYLFMDEREKKSVLENFAKKFSPQKNDFVWAIQKWRSDKGIIFYLKPVCAEKDGVGFFKFQNLYAEVKPRLNSQFQLVPANIHYHLGEYSVMSNGSRDIQFRFYFEDGTSQFNPMIVPKCEDEHAAYRGSIRFYKE